MVNFLSKEMRITSQMSKKGRKEFLVLNIITICCFVLAAFGIFQNIYFICNMIGSIVLGAPYQGLEELLRVFPVVTGYFSSIYLFTVLYHLTFPVSKAKRQRLFFVGGIKFICIGGFMLLYFIIGLFTGLYHALIEPSNSILLFPLNSMFLGVVYVVMGILGVIYSKKNSSYETELIVNNYETHGAKAFARGVLSVLVIIGAGFGLAALIYAPWTIDISPNIDYRNSGVLYAIGLILTLLVPIVYLGMFYFIYLPLKRRNKSEFGFYCSLVTLIVAVVSYAIYIVGLTIYPNAPSTVAYGILPVEFTASVNVYTYIFLLLDIVPPLITFIWNRVSHKHHSTREVM